MFRNKLHKWTKFNLWGIVLCIFLPLSLYALILATRFPFPVRPLALAARYSFTLVVPVVTLAFWSAFRMPGKTGMAVGFSAVLVVFGLSLVGLWASGQSETSVVSGLLPWTDASSYYRDGRRLLEGMGFLEKSTWRPLFPALLSVILGITGQNLVVSTGILVAITSAAAFLSAREVQRTHGSAAAALYLTIIFFYYRKISGTTLSENLGLALALLGFGLLWRGAGLRNKRDVLMGVFFSAMALNARPGAFITLPFIVLWGAWFFRSKGPLNWGFLLQEMLAVLAAFAIHLLVMFLTAEKPGMPFSNFSYAFYGLAVGGKGFYQTFIDHPEIRQITGMQHHLTVFSLAFNAILENPSNIILGALKQWQLILFDSTRSFFSYFSGENRIINSVYQWGLSILCLLSALQWLKRKDIHFALIAAAFTGLMLSVPFVPPTDARYMRLYAASMPVVALLPALGLNWLLDRGWLRSLNWSPDKDYSPLGAPALGFGLMAVILLGSAGIRWLAPTTATPVTACDKDQEPALIRYLPGSYVRIYREMDFFLDWLPNFHEGRYKRFVHNLPNAPEINEFAGIEVPATLINGLDLVTGNDIYFIATSGKMPAEYGLLAACGRYSQNPEVESFHFYYPEKIELIDPRW